MAIKFGSDGTLYCNTVKYNYKQAINLVPNACFNADVGFSTMPTVWSLSHDVTVVPLQGASGSNMAIQFEYEMSSHADVWMPTPIRGHKYYGGCMWNTFNGFEAVDARFEWWLNDSNKMVFANKGDTGGSWVKLSSIQTLSSVASGNWRLRNFVKNGTEYSYCTKVMIIDLTDTFGAGNEPSKEWCDENILEWSKFYMGPETVLINENNYNTAFAGGTAYYNYLSETLIPDSSIATPKDYFIKKVGGSSAETYLNSTSNLSLNTSYMYYGFFEEAHTSLPIYTTMDIYFPVAEPLIGQTPLVDNTAYNGGGAATYWKRVSMLNNRSSFTRGDYPQRFDLNNGGQSTTVWITNIGIISLYIFRLAARLFTPSTGGWTDTSSYNTIYTKPFMDRRYGGQNMTIIHIPDPSKKQIKFNTNYDIVCNDIIPDPSNSRVWFDTNGRIHCKTIITDQKY